MKWRLLLGRLAGCCLTLLACGLPMLVSSMAWAGAAPAAETSKPEALTRERYAEYIRQFNARDEHYADLYSDSVTFDHGPYYGMLRGRQAIVSFYRDTWKSFQETLVPGQVIIDTEHGLIAAELTTHLLALVDGVASQSHPEGMKKGDEVVSIGVVIYAVKDGRITNIRGAPQKSVFHTASALSATAAPFPLSLEPLSAQARAEVESSYRHYVDCFNSRDVPCFTRFYDPEVVFVVAPLPEMDGSDAIVAFYRNAWKHLHEHIVIRSVELSGNRLKVDMQNTIDVFADYPDFPPHPLHKGDHYTIHGAVVYELNEGRFMRISDEHE